MRVAIPLALVLAATATSHRGCGSGNGTAPYDPCARKACGDDCTVCAPGDPECAETAVVKACDPLGRCVPKVDGLCGPVQSECAGKACGTECAYPDLPCLHANPPCMPPVSPGYCDQSGACTRGYPPPPGACPLPPPSWGCIGKACGDSCGYCPPGQDPATCPVPTFAPTACDVKLQCVTEGTFTCPPDPCAGLKCGDGCDPCGGLCMNPVPYYCDGSGACVSGAVSCSP